MRSLPFLLGSFLVLEVFAMVPLAVADQGVFEINDACATSNGCFIGDGAGYPVTIAAPGSYRLTSNVGFAVAAEQIADLVEITAEDVTLDLAGFQVTCRRFAAGEPCSGESKGIVSSARGTSVYNGSVTGVASNGVELGDDARVVDVTVHNTGGSGVVVGRNGTVRGTISTGNADTGISLNASSTIEGCTARENSVGISTGQYSSARGNSAWNNSSSGFIGGRGSTLVDNTAASNGGDGFSLSFSLIASDNGGLAKGNVAVNNGGFGFDNGELGGPFPGVIANSWGLIDNVANENNGGGDQIRGGIEMGQNVCGQDLICP